MQRNIIGERLLGLPREPPPTAGEHPGGPRDGPLRARRAVLVATIDRPGDDLNRVDHAVHHDLTALFAGCGPSARRGRCCSPARVGPSPPAATSPGSRAPGARRLDELRLDAKALIWDLLDVPHADRLRAQRARRRPRRIDRAALRRGVHGRVGDHRRPPRAGRARRRRRRHGGLAAGGRTDAGQALPAHRRPGRPRPTRPSLGLVTEAVPDDEVLERGVGLRAPPRGRRPAGACSARSRR